VLVLTIISVSSRLKTLCKNLVLYLISKGESILGSPFFCSAINNSMASIKDPQDNVIHVSPNVVISLSDDNIGEMYIYDDNYMYVLNGMTASDLVGYFNSVEDYHLSDEIVEVLMDMTINQGTH
jgi:hypothetical protein